MTVMFVIYGVAGGLSAAIVTDFVQGLMTMAPSGLPSTDLRRVFSGLRDLRDRYATPEAPLPELSMGMSSDFEEAVLEGATLVRVGSALYDGVPRG